MSAETFARLNARALNDAGLIDALRRAQRAGDVNVAAVFDDERRARIAACDMCRRFLVNLDRAAPPHFASTRCESGRRSHCSCDTCY